MATSNGAFLQTDPSTPSPTLPPWLSNSNNSSTVRPSPSVTLSLSSPTAPYPPIPWLQPPERPPERPPENMPFVLTNLSPQISACGGGAMFASELAECCRELDEGHRAWAAHKKETAWRLRRVELQLESEKAARIRQKMEEIEGKVKAVREEEKIALERIEAEFKEQLAGLRKDAEAKEQKLAEQWTAKHLSLTKFLEHMGCRSRIAESSGR